MIAQRYVGFEIVKMYEYSHGSVFVLFVTKRCGVEINSMGMECVS